MRLKTAFLLIIIYHFFVLSAFTDELPADDYCKPEWTCTQTLHYPGDYTAAADIQLTKIRGYIRLRTEPLPDIRLHLDSASFAAFPLVKKNAPILALYGGSFLKKNIFSHAQTVLGKSPLLTANTMSNPASSFFSLQKTGKEVAAAAEASMYGVTIGAAVLPEKKQLPGILFPDMHYGIAVGGGNPLSKDVPVGWYAAAFFGASPYPIITDGSPRRRYQTFYAADVHIHHPMVKSRFFTMLNYLPNNTPGFTVQTDTQVFFPYGSFRIAAAYADQHAQAWRHKPQKTGLRVSPWIKLAFPFVSIRGMYEFYWQNTSSPIMVHTWGSRIKFTHTNVTVISQVIYKKQYYTFSGSVQFTPSKEWFRNPDIRVVSLTASNETTMQRKSENPFVVKKYRFAANLKAQFTPLAAMRIDGSITQANVLNKKTGYISWISPEYRAGIGLVFTWQKRLKHQAKIGCTYKNYPHRVEVSLQYSISN